MTPQTGPEGYGPPPARKSGHSLALPKSRLASVFNAPVTPRLDAILAAAGMDIQQSQLSEARCATLDAERRDKVEDMLARAAGEGWSQRELARRAGLKWSSWHRLKTGQIDLVLWLPRLREASNRLQQQAAA
jgi:hypothetical protein